MKIGTKIAAAGIATLALAGGLLVTGVDAASAATTGNGGVAVGWQPDPNNLGNLSFYDATGKQITTGSLNASPMAAYYVSNAPSTATSGGIQFTTPVAGTNSGTWAGTQQVGSPNAFPVAGLPGDLAGFGGAVVKGAATDGSFQAVQIAGFPNNDTTSGYQNLYEVRMFVNGVTSKWYAADIQVNSTAGTWTQVYPNQTAANVTLSSPATATAATAGGSATYTLTATLSSAQPGKVEFSEGTTVLGSSAVSGTTATLSVTAPVGAHSYSARFVPTPGSAGLQGTNGTSSTSVVNPATATTIAFVSQNVGTYANDNGQFVFGVTPSNAVGQVNFTDSFTPAGSTTAQTVALGSVPSTSAVVSGTQANYTLNTTNLPAGSHQVSAQFVPSNPANFAASNTASGTAFSYAASPTVGPAVTSNVTTTVPAGIVTITTPYGGGGAPSTVFDLGPLGLDNTASYLVGSATFPKAGDDPITITDTRSGGLPWTATVTSSDMTNATGDRINGQNFGFDPTAVGSLTFPAGNSLNGKVDVFATLPANGAAPADAGTMGLKGGPIFAKVKAGQSGVGTAYIRGLLSMKAPTSTKSGKYNGTLTFTVIGS